MSLHQDFFSVGASDQAADFDFGQYDSGYPPPRHDPAGQQAYAYGQPAAASFFDPSSMDGGINTDPFAANDDPYADEPPLLEELGINFDHITQKTLAVVNPLRSTDASILHDSDLAGPLVFIVAFGCFLLLSGKVSFGYIYGIGVLGCLSMYALLNLMSPPETPISILCTASVLGYCLLPMVLLSGISVLFNLNSGIGGFVLVGLTVAWCSLSASGLFVTALQLNKQQALIIYPCALLYGVFALLTVF